MFSVTQLDIEGALGSVTVTPADWRGAPDGCCAVTALVDIHLDLSPQDMSSRPYDELRRTFSSTSVGDSDAIREAFEELEALFQGAVEEKRLDEFLHRDVSGSIQAIACQPRMFVLAMLRWLPNDDYHELSGAVRYCIDVHYLQATTPALFDLTGSEPARAQAVALRLVGSNASPAVSLGWILSLASVHEANEEVATLVNELMKHHMNELPASTEKLLSTDQNPLVNLEVARAALDQLRSFSEHLKKLPQARELAMPVQMRLMYAGIRRKRNRTINAGAERESFFSRLFQPQRFKYSTRAAVEIHHENRTEETTLTMAPFSVSIELPISEATDPVAGNIRRDNFLKRGKL